MSLNSGVMKPIKLSHGKTSFSGARKSFLLCFKVGLWHFIVFPESFHYSALFGFFMSGKQDIYLIFLIWWKMVVLGHL